MALNFSTRYAPDSDTERVQLVDAVLNAATEDETGWLEFKSDLDIAVAGKAGRASLARAICGMANRLPSVAELHCEGRAYIVIGATPAGL